MNSFDLLLYGCPDWAWWTFAFVAGLSLSVAFSMVGIRAWCSKSRNLVLLAYERPRLVRISQSPAWTGALLLAMGLVYIEAGARWPSMDARVYAELHRVWVAKATGDVTIDLLEEIQRSQLPWAALREKQVATISSWVPSEDLSRKVNARTRAERAFWKVVRIFRRGRKPALVIVIVGATQMGSAQWLTRDDSNLQNNIYQFSAQGVRERIGQLWSDSQQQARWVTDLVQTYRTIKMARSAYESLATFDLVQNVNLIDLIPQIDLAEGQYFGGEENGFSERGGNSQYVSLRFKMNPSGGIAKTLNFSNLAKFKPKLRVNVDQLASQLANLDFDAVQMVQYRGPSGELKGSPIEVGKAVSARLSLWDEILKGANDFIGQRQREADSYNALQGQISAENMAFDRAARDLQDQAQKADDDLKKRLAGKDVPPDMPATYDMIYSPRVQLARRILAADQAGSAGRRA